MSSPSPGRQPSPGRVAGDSADLQLFMVEHDLNTLTRKQLTSAHHALVEAVRREALRGRRIRYLQRIFVPGEGRFLYLFEADGPELVRGIYDIAQFPLARVVAVTSCPRPGAGRAQARCDQPGA